MSRVNRVNPSMYTQAGRLTPDDAAREQAKQRSASGRPRMEPRDRREPWRHQAENARRRMDTRDANGPGVPARHIQRGPALVLACAFAAVVLTLVGLRRGMSARPLSRGADQPF